MKKQIFPRLTCLIFGVLVICFLIAFYSFAAWQEPSQPQPGGNVDAPLNAGPDGQVKIGGLMIATGEVTTGLIVANGNVGIGTTSPGAKLHVAGTAGTDGIMFPDGTLQTTAGARFRIYGSYPGILDGNQWVSKLDQITGNTQGYSQLSPNVLVANDGSWFLQGFDFTPMTNKPRAHALVPVDGNGDIIRNYWEISALP